MKDREVLWLVGMLVLVGLVVIFSKNAESSAEPAHISRCRTTANSLEKSSGTLWERTLSLLGACSSAKGPSAMRQY